MTIWKHDDLANDLASHLRATRDRIIWTDMQMGPSGSPRPDVYSIPFTYARFFPLAYEIKVSVADYRRDVIAGKWQSYLKYAGGVIFAVPSGMIAKADIPPGTGLMVRGPDGWRTLKAPTLGRVENLPREAWLKLVIDGIGRESRRAETLPGKVSTPARKAEKAIAKKYGSRLAEALSDMNRAETYLRAMQANAEAQNEALEKEIEAKRKRAIEQSLLVDSEIKGVYADLAVALGLPRDAQVHEFVRAAHIAQKRLNLDAEVQRLRRLLETVETALQAAREPMPAICETLGGAV